MDALAECPGQHLTLDASGPAVGLPEGLMGNSEVGHFTIGTGRTVYQVKGHHLLLWVFLAANCSESCYTI